MLLLVPGRRGGITLGLRDDDGSRCWESVFPKSKADTSRLFRALLP